ncbi:MAG: HEPN domain-containing protein [Chloroflexi bacterium]|nr:HEPN domain-containing protein [Chloroflexota bacterium]
MSENELLRVAKKWLAYADGDLRVAEHSMNDVSPSYHTICFLCQSAGEKFLKGYLIVQGWRLEKTHDLLALLNHCVEYDASFGELVEGGTFLNEYVVAGRYPGDLSIDDIGRADAEEALLAAKSIRGRVVSALGLGA